MMMFWSVTVGCWYGFYVLNGYLSFVRNQTLPYYIVCEKQYVIRVQLKMYLIFLRQVFFALIFFE